MKKVLLLLGLLLTGCSTTWHVSTVGHDPIYDTVLEVPADVQIDTLNYRQLQWKLRTDFNFRYDFAQYALSQPRSFDWNNRILGNRYSFYNPYWNYNYYWNRDMMWNDWVWGYPYSNWSWNSWNRPYWGWNNSWWNGYNSWYNGPWHNPGYNIIWNSSRRNTNVAYHSGRRGSNNIVNRVIVNRNKPRVNVNQNNRRRINDKPIRVYNNPNNPNINNNSKPVRGYGRPEINNSSSPRIYNRPPTSTNNSTVRPSSTIRRGSSNSRGGDLNKRN